MTGADDDALVWPDDAVEVGRIVDAWGVKGWLKIQPFSAQPEALFSSKRWFLQAPEPQPGRPAPRPAAPGAVRYPRLLKVVSAKEHGEGVVAQVQDIADRGGAEALKGARVFVPRASFPTPEADEFYWVDLIGLQVVNLEGVVLGTVAGLIDTGPQSVLRVAPPEGGEERLIPFVDAYVRQVEIAERRITVDWGLDY